MLRDIWKNNFKARSSGKGICDAFLQHKAGLQTLLHLWICPELPTTGKNSLQLSLADIGERKQPGDWSGHRKSNWAQVLLLPHCPLARNERTLGAGWKRFVQRHHRAGKARLNSAKGSGKLGGSTNAFPSPGMSAHGEKAECVCCVAKRIQGQYQVPVWGSSPSSKQLSAN